MNPTAMPHINPVAVIFLTLTVCLPAMPTQAPAQSTDIQLDDARITALQLTGRDILRHRQPAALWTLELWDPDTKTATRIPATGDDTHSVTSNEPDDQPGWTRWTIARDGESLAELDTRVTVDGDTVRFEGALVSLSDQYHVKRWWYPNVPLQSLDGSKTDACLTPIAYGQVVPNIHHRGTQNLPGVEDRLPSFVRSHYPSKRGTLQMNFLFVDAGGVLFMTPDPTRRIKEYILHPDDHGPVASFIHIPHDITPVEQRTELPYPVELSWVDGTWYDAAQRYRDWAVTQEWATDPGSLDERDDLPDWFAGLPSWVRIQRDPSIDWDVKTRWPLTWLDAVGGPMGIHWYGWDIHGGPMNRDWPDHFPPDPRTLPQLKQYQDAGMYVMPYVNARIFATNGPNWDQWKDMALIERDGTLGKLGQWLAFGDEEEMKRAKANGQPIEKPRTPDSPWGIRYKFTDARVAHPRWQQTIIDRTQHLVSDYGFDMVYQDQVDSGAYLDFADDNPTPPGDPYAWREGYEQTYQQISNAWLDQGIKAPLVSEYNNESLMPFIHGSLVASTGSTMQFKHVPLFAAVYHTHYVMIGWPDQFRVLEQRPDFYTLQWYIPLVYGAQLGWFSYTIDDLIEDHPDIVAGIRDAVTLRRDYPDCLGSGKMLRPPHVDGVPMIDAPLENDRKAINPQPTPAVLAGLFRSSDDQNKALAVFANWTHEPQGGTASIDLSELGPNVTVSTTDGKTLGTFTGDTAELPIQLGPASLMGVVIQANP